jgi:hypothetical protein
MPNDVLQLIGTLLQGGVLVVLVRIAWKGATFVQWVRSEFEANHKEHSKIEAAIKRVNIRVNDIEE